MQGARLDVIKSEFAFFCFETNLDRAATPSDFHQFIDHHSARRPCFKEGRIAVSDFPTNQQSESPEILHNHIVIIAYKLMSWMPPPPHQFTVVKPDLGPG